MFVPFQKKLKEFGSLYDNAKEIFADRLPTAAPSLSELFDSESASVDRDLGPKTAAIRSMMNPVNLDETSQDNMTRAFYTRDRSIAFPLVEQLARVQSQINGMFTFFRLCLSEARTLAHMSNAEIQAFLNERAEKIAEDIKLNADGSKDASIRSFLRQTASGRMHTIKPSSRYTGGYDFQFVGVTEGRSTLSPSKGGYPVISYSWKGIEQDTVYKSEYLEAYATYFSQNVVAAAEEILGSFDMLDRKAALQTIVHTLPLNYKFSKFNDVFFKHTGIFISTNFISDVDPSTYSELEKFYSILFIRSPKKEIVEAAKSFAKKQKEYNEGERETYNPEKFLTKEGMALSQNLSMSISINIPQNIAEYISQAEKGEKISLLSLNTWMTTWSQQYLKMPRSSSETGRIGLSRLPRYVLPISKTLKVTELRKESGLNLEHGRCDDKNITIAPDGSLMYIPKQSARSNSNVVSYEKDMEDHMNLCFSLGIPPSTKVLPDDVYAISDIPDIEKTFYDSVEKINKYTGKLLSYDWDYNFVITVNAENPTAMVTSNLNGAAVPDALTIADYLGTNLAKPGEDPLFKTFSDSIQIMLNDMPVEDKDGTPIDRIATSASPSKMLHAFSPMSKLLLFYRNMAMQGKVPGCAELLRLALKEIPDEDYVNYEMSYVFSNVITENKTVASPYNVGNNDIIEVDNFIQRCLDIALTECSGNNSSRLRYRLSLELGPASYNTLDQEVQDHELYFYAKNSTARDFGRVYKLIGGMIFKIAMSKLVNLTPDDLFGCEVKYTTENTGGKANKPGFSTVANEIMPLAVMFSKYIPDADRIMSEADVQIETNRPNPSINASDVCVPGTNEGAQLLPHQVIAHKSLRNHPKFAILDIAPGGGKTSITLTDIGSIRAELPDEDIKPLVICPDSLIKNWIDDMRIFVGEKWNMLPIDNVSFSRWGPDKLRETIERAPPNTIVVAGFNFLANNVFRLAMGTLAVRISSNIEFIKSFGFNYIAIDESHKLKNKKTGRHNYVKQLTTASFVKYVRILSGTIIADKVSDIVGQTALVNSHIFRDREFTNDLSVTEAIERRRKLILNGDVIPSWEVDTPQRARQKLSNYAAVIQLKRKEWAFMLPTPIENFIAVPLEPTLGADGSTEEDVFNGQLHQQLYDTVLKDSMAELEALIEKAKKRKKKSDDDDDDESEEEDDDETTVSAGDLELDEDEGDFAGISKKDLWPYIARLEMLVVNPMADPIAPKIFGEAGVTSYVSQKARTIAKRVDEHFNPPKWDKGTLYNEYAFVTHGGKFYFARKADQSEYRPTKLPESSLGIPPDVNKDVWKEEPEGKVIIVTRYNSSVSGIYEALPKKYQQIAVRYTGLEQDKHSNLDAFISDPNVKILIANETGISVGHNLQMASRLIRAESPWGPGELDQTASRIFRPDPKASKNAYSGGKPGELYRDVIFLDWVLANKTMEVAKQSRLIRKVFKKAQFEEVENVRKFKVRGPQGIIEQSYSDVLDRYDLEDIRMDLKTMRSKNSLDDSRITPFINAYKQLNALVRQEFHEMRLTQDMDMKNLEERPMMPGASKILVPFVSGMRAPTSDENFVSLRDYMRDKTNSDAIADPKILIGRPVMTDKGKGQIENVRVRYKKEGSDAVPVAKRKKETVYDSDGNIVKAPKVVQKKMVDEFGNKVVDPNNPISSVEIRYKDGTTESINTIGIVFLPTTIDNRRIKREYEAGSPSKVKLSGKEEEAARRKEEANRKRAEEEELEEARKAARRAARLEREAEARRQAAEDAKKRQENIDKGRPINAGVKKVKQLPDPNMKIMQKDADGAIALHPASYHGYLVLEAEVSDPDSVNLSKLGFKESGPYAYVAADRYARFDKILSYLEDNFNLSEASISRLIEIQAAFEKGGRQVYRSDLAPTSSLPYFFATRKKIVTDRKEIRPYPIIMPDEVIVAVDIKTCPAITKHIGRAIPGATTTWTRTEGNVLYFAKNKSDLKSKIKEIKAKGIVISNEDELDKEVANLRFKAPKAK